jgi:hypothetical protein
MRLMKSFTGEACTVSRGPFRQLAAITGFHANRQVWAEALEILQTPDSAK